MCSVTQKFMAHSVSGMVQLFPLFSQLLNDFCANLFCLVGNAMTSFNTLVGVIQRLSAL